RLNTLRKVDSVSTSDPAFSTTLLNTSESANDVAAMMPGPSAASRVWDSIRSAMDQRAGAVIGEQLEQDRMRDAAVKNDHAFHAFFQRVEAGFDLGDHAAGDGAVGDQPSHVRRRHLLD